MRIVAAPDAGSPDDEMTCTPGVVPASALVTFVLTRDSIVLASTIAADPVKELFVAVPYAITIVSSRLSVSGSREMFSVVRPSIFTSLLL